MKGIKWLGFGLAVFSWNNQDNDANLLEGQPFSFNNLVQLSLLNVRGENTNKLDKYLRDTGCRNNKDCLYQLHQILIEPIAEFLPTDPNQNVVFIPQDNIYRVPFAALMDANGQYLIENHTISISPNIGIYQNLHDKLQEKATQTENILVVGNPKMPEVKLSRYSLPQTLSQLPGTEYEAKEIAKLYNTTPLIGEEATEPTVKQKMSQASIIHLATHGFEQVATATVQGVLQPAIVVTSSEELNRNDYDSDDFLYDGLLTLDGSLTTFDGSSPLDLTAKLMCDSFSRNLEIGGWLASVE